MVSQGGAGMVLWDRFMGWFYEGFRESVQGIGKKWWGRYGGKEVV